MPEIVETALKLSVQRCLDHYQTELARFLAERLYYECKSEENLNLWARTLMQGNNYLEASILLNFCTSSDNKYLKAMCLFKSGNIVEAEHELLTQNSNISLRNLAEQSTSDLLSVIPGGVYGIFLLGEVLFRLSHFELAEVLFSRVIQIDISLSASCLSMLSKCSTSLTTISDMHSLLSASATSTSSSPIVQNLSNHSSSMSPIGISADITPINMTKSSLKSDTMETPRIMTRSRKKLKNIDEHRSLPLFTPHASSSFNSDVSQFVDFMSSLSDVTLLFGRHEYEKCLDLVNHFPYQQQSSSGWLHQIRMSCHINLNQYNAAVKWGDEMMRIEPYRWDGIDILSSAYWHTGNLSKLQLLSSRSKQQSSGKAQTWVVIANCLSLCNDHDRALVSLERAHALDPYYSYCHIVAGHELLLSKPSNSSDSSNLALLEFRKAMKLEPHSFHAWFGIGSYFFQMDRPELAEYYFSSAVRLNQSNPLLLAFYALSLQSQGKISQAVNYLEAAIQLNPEMSTIRYQYAAALTGAGKLDKALDEYEKVSQFVPSESVVHVQMAKILIELKRHGEAKVQLQQALVLDPQVNDKAICELIQQCSAVSIQASEIDLDWLN